MSDVSVTVANYLFGWLAIVVVWSWFCALCFPYFSRLISSADAWNASFYTMLYGLLAPVIASVALVTLATPDFAFPLVSDHCHGLDCAPHNLHISTDSSLSWFMALIGVSVIAGLITLIALQLFNNRKRLRALSGLSERKARYRLVESHALVAWCAGLLKPEVYLSRGLVNVLTPKQLEYLLAHEQAHVQRRDNLRKWVMYWATVAWPKTQRLRIRAELTHFNELASDGVMARLKPNIEDIARITEIMAGGNIKSQQDHPITKAKVKQAAHHVILPSERIQALQGDADQRATTARLQPLLYLALMGGIAFVCSVHFGHPLLELLARLH